MQTILM